MKRQGGNAMARRTDIHRNEVRRVFGVAAVVILAAGGTIARAEAAERFTLQGTNVAIYNLAGKVEVATGSGRDVVVEVVRGGEDAGDLRIETGAVGGKETLRVRYPGTTVIYPALGARSSTQMRVHHDGTFGGKARDVFAQRVTIRGSGSGTRAYADLRVLVPAGSDVAVYVGAGAMVAEDVEADLRLDNGSGPISCAAMRGALAVDTGSGVVRVDGSRGGPVSIDTGSGEVFAKDIEGTQLGIDTGSGSVDVEGAVVGILAVDTGSGGVTVNGLKADQIKVDTGSGSVRIGLESHARSVLVDTGSGSVILAVPDRYGAEFLFDTGSGGIDVEPEHTVSHKGYGELRGRIGDGSGKLHVDTGSGSIHVRRAT